MSFISKIENLNKKLEAFNNAGQIEKETIELAKIYNQIEENCKNTQEILGIIKIFKKRNLEIETNNQLKENTSTFLFDTQKRYNEEKSSDSIKKGPYSKYLNNNSDLISDLEIKIKNEWKVYCNKIYSRETYSTLYSQFNSPENEEILNEFESLYEEFSDLLNLNQVSEISEEMFIKVTDIGNRLSEKRSQIKDNYHDDVRKFLNAVADNQATLDLYTEEVIKWINNNNLEDRYKIINNVN